VASKEYDMSKVAILASVFALAVGTAGCGNSQGQSNSLADIGPSTVSRAPSEGSSGNLATLAKGGGGGKRGGGGSNTTGNGSLSLVMVTDNNGDGLPNWSDSVTFNVSTTESQPNVDVKCSQNGVVVYSATAGFYDGYPWPWATTMMLKSNAWQGGAADCTARLYIFSGSGSTTLASISFAAYA
jgi:hypothetical protein